MVIFFPQFIKSTLLHSNSITLHKKRDIESNFMAKNEFLNHKNPNPDRFV